MGQDKGLIEREGICWALRMGRKLSPLGLQVIYSIRLEQASAYSFAIPEGLFIPDSIDRPGPLNGLVSVHRRFPERDLILLGCDLQDLDADTIGEVIGVYRSEPGAECYVYREGKLAQPFCGVYTARGLQKAFSRIGADRSLQGLIRRMDVRYLELTRRNAFQNYNSLP